MRWPCLFRVLTGLYCPGCGGTRAVRELLTGHPVRSFLYYPLVPYSAVVALWLLISHLLYRYTGNERYHRELELGYVYVGIAVIILNFVIKNVILLSGTDVLELLSQGRF